MINRRDFVRWGVATPAFAASISVVSANAPTGLDGFVLDTRFASEAAADRTGLKTYRIADDVTPLWFKTLDPLWRKPGFVLGGVTGKDVLFVLETLAWDRGRRVISREAMPSGAHDAVSWIIAPTHPSVRG